MASRFVLATIGFAMFVPSLFAQESAGSRVYKTAVKSVAWVHSPRDNGLATGTGSLIDLEKRLVLTNYHVVEDHPKVRIFFPAYRNGQPIAEKTYYTDRAKSLSIGGVVIAKDRTADLALIQLDSAPDGVPALSLAPTSAEPGQLVHSIGNTGKSDALWGYVQGKVRQVYQKSWKAQIEPRRVLSFSARVVETDSPTNPGDSGGPLLNDKGELAGVTQGGATNAQLVSTFIDVSEVRKLYRADPPKAPTGGSKPVAKAAARKEALPIKDDAKMFKDETVKQLETQVKDVYKKHKLDLQIETHTAAPEKELEKFKGATPQERTKLMREWAKARMSEEKGNGIIILISNNPRSFYIEMTGEAMKKLPDDITGTLIKTLTDGLKNKKPDEGITNTVKAIVENIKP